MSTSLSHCDVNDCPDAPVGHPPARSYASVFCDAFGKHLAAGVVLLACLGILKWDPQWFWQDDFQSYQLANYWEIGRGWHDGEIPLLSSNSWECTALAGEYQNGVFSIVLSALACLTYSLKLSLPTAAAVFSISHLTVLAAGTFRLARKNGLSTEASLFVAWNTTFAGWIMIWGARAWFPALASFAWLPWFWSRLEEGMQHPRDEQIPSNPQGSQGLWRRFVPAGIYLYLIITAGWPFTVLMAMLVSGWLGLRQCVSPLIGSKKRPQQSFSEVISVWPIVAAWCIGMGLSAPAWMMLLEYASETVRGQASATQLEDDWTVPLLALPAFFLPVMRLTWNVFGTIKEHTSIEMSGGLLPVALTLAALLRFPRQTWKALRWEVGLAVIVLCLAILPSVGTFRWSFRWIPLLILVLSIMGGKAIRYAADDSNRRTLSAGHISAILVLLSWLSFLWIRDSVDAESIRAVAVQGIVLIGICLAWRVCTRDWKDDVVFGRTVAFFSLLFAVFALGFPAPPLEFPHWDACQVEQQMPRDRSKRYLSIHEWSDLFDTDVHRVHRPISASGRGVLPGNFNQYVGVEYINGYSPMQPIGLHEVFRIGPHGYLGIADPLGCDSYLQPALDVIEAEAGEGGLLDLMGVNGLIVADRHRALIPSLESRGWRVEELLQGSTVLLRDQGGDRAVRAIAKGWVSSDWNAVVKRVQMEKYPAKSREEMFPIFMEGRDEIQDTQFVNSNMPRGYSRSFSLVNLGRVISRRCSVHVDVQGVDGGETAMVVFARPWMPGYRARFQGKEIPVGRFCTVLPCVEIPADVSGPLVLEYFPPSLQKGIFAMLLTGLAVGFLGAWDLRQGSLCRTALPGTKGTLTC
jgi:hypothetical protein